jgi:hypothetical protein
MAGEIPTACRTPRCAGYAYRGGRGYCADCLKNQQPNDNPALRYKTNDKKSEVDLWYHRAPWQKFIKTLKALNPICQVIDAQGHRCTNPSKLGHHLESPFVAPSKFLSPGNVVCICAEHHTPDEGEAADLNRTFAPTKWLFGTTYEPKPRPPLKQGEVRLLENGTAIVGQ